MSMLTTLKLLKNILRSWKGCLSCCEVNGQYIRSIDENVDADHEESKWVLSMTDLYNKIHTKRTLFINKYSKKLEVIQRSPKEACTCKLGLQKLKFDKFDGEIRKYPRFKEQFLSYIKPQY